MSETQTTKPEAKTKVVDPKVASIHIAAMIRPELHDALVKKCAASGISKYRGIQLALAAFLGMEPDPAKREKKAKPVKEKKAKPEKPVKEKKEKSAKPASKTPAPKKETPLPPVDDDLDDIDDLDEDDDDLDDIDEDDDEDEVPPKKNSVNRSNSPAAIADARKAANK